MIVKNFQFLKRGIGIEGEKIIEKSSRSKVWKQIREWKQVEHRAQCSLYLKQNSKAFAIPILNYRKKFEVKSLETNQRMETG